MSSEAGSLKKSAEEVANEEPSAKKVKIAEPEEKNATSNEQTDRNETSNNNNNNNNNKSPSKPLNGNADSGEGASHYSENDEDVDDEEEDAEDLNRDGGRGAFDSKITSILKEADTTQQEICNLNEKASEEILKVEEKYNKLRRPHFEKRSELLRGIPDFWVTVMTNHPIIEPMIGSKEEQDCLQYLVNLDVEEFEDIKSGFKLKLQFEDNPYITNDTIVKEFQVISPDEIASTVSPPLEFKNTPPGQKLKQIVQENIGRRRRDPRLNQQQSFFAWLSESTKSSADEVADIIKDQLWPNPLDYFLTTGYGSDEYGSDESDEDDEELDDEDLDEEDLREVDGIEGDFSDEELQGEGGEDGVDDEEDFDEEDPEE